VTTPNDTVPASTPTATTPPATIHLTSPAFRSGRPIPRAYTCDGADLPVPLRWSGVPPSARELWLVMRDPDAPGGSFVHWAVARIPASVTHLGGTASLPPDAIAGRNSFGKVGYNGPCPPKGDRPHHYVITLTAVGRSTGSGSTAAAGSGYPPNRVHAAPVAVGTLVGTYGR
jgi:hypothetical protein